MGHAAGFKPAVFGLAVGFQKKCKKVTKMLRDASACRLDMIAKSK